eukprot:gnl/Dysnectes_brevis/3740_a4797_473.p1 GENE.gnl/Dysnectes_brevis/3740_a4797_473~~gnl/Dysnectes_brevis/3740_a4797_473.p1  ORF type:complete len:556 (-),score=144.41 gnl/Dysnectes_brevis/3740_a4797_473:1214-2881(-)
MEPEQLIEPEHMDSESSGSLDVMPLESSLRPTITVEEDVDVQVVLHVPSSSSSSASITQNFIIKSNLPVSELFSMLSAKMTQSTSSSSSEQVFDSSSFVLHLRLPMVQGGGLLYLPSTKTISEVTHITCDDILTVLLVPRTYLIRIQAIDGVVKTMSVSATEHTSNIIERVLDKFLLRGSALRSHFGLQAMHGPFLDHGRTLPAQGVLGEDFLLFRRRLFFPLGADLNLQRGEPALSQAFLHAERFVFNGDVHVPAGPASYLGALKLQLWKGDSRIADKGKGAQEEELDAFLPPGQRRDPDVRRSVMRDHGRLVGMSRTLCMLNFVRHASRLNGYGVTVFPAAMADQQLPSAPLDPVFLAVSAAGLAVRVGPRVGPRDPGREENQSRRVLFGSEGLGCASREVRALMRLPASPLWQMGSPGTDYAPPTSGGGRECSPGSLLAWVPIASLKRVGVTCDDLLVETEPRKLLPRSGTDAVGQDSRGHPQGGCVRASFRLGPLAATAATLLLDYGLEFYMEHSKKSAPPLRPGRWSAHIAGFQPPHDPPVAAWGCYPPL